MGSKLDSIRGEYNPVRQPIVTPKWLDTSGTVHVWTHPTSIPSHPKKLTKEDVGWIEKILDRIEKLEEEKFRSISITFSMEKATKNGEVVIGRIVFKRNTFNLTVTHRFTSLEQALRILLYEVI